MKKPPIKTTYHPPRRTLPYFMKPSPARLEFDREPTEEQVKAIQDYLSGIRFMTRGPGKRVKKVVEGVE